ncbi:MAG: repressor LexA [Clostridia bacterium]|nr:repressor LexA [Clostridia bacterium]
MKRIDEVKLNEVYQYICDCHSTERRSPTYREIANACDINSTAWVSSLVGVLEERGLIELEAHGNKRTISVPDNLAVGESINASIVGTCPCGEPVLAVENITATVALPVEIFGSEEHFILKAKGNSMIKRGIFDGDLMVVRVQNTANIGEVVIARVNYNEEATAKILACKRGKYYLKAANDEVDENGEALYKDIHPKGDWEILGVVDNVIHSPTKEVL